MKHCTRAEHGAGRRLHSSLSTVQAELFSGDVHPASQMQLYLGCGRTRARIRTRSQKTLDNLTKPPAVYPLTLISIIEWLLFFLLCD